MGKLEVCFSRNNKTSSVAFIKDVNIPTNVIIPDIFNNIECKIYDILIKFKYVSNTLVVVFEDDKDDFELKEKMFFKLYNYMGIILGYFPKIISSNYFTEKKLKNIVEKYNTNSKYVRSIEQYIQQLDNASFQKSFISFLDFYKKASFQISTYNLAIMETTCYPEVAIVNILQALDGLFNNLTFMGKYQCLITQEEVKRYRNKIKYPESKEIIIGSELSLNLNDNEIQERIEWFEQNKYNSIIQINKICYSERLSLLFDSLLIDIFQYEKNLKDENRYNYEKLVTLLKNTRNKFSHSSSEIGKNLSGTESAIYIYKLVIVIRLLIFKEIELENNIDINKLNKSIDNINEKIKKELIDKEAQ